MGWEAVVDSKSMQHGKVLFDEDRESLHSGGGGDGWASYPFICWGFPFFSSASSRFGGEDDWLYLFGECCRVPFYVKSEEKIPMNLMM